MKGNKWNESRLYQDPVTLRNVRQITTKGTVNTVPSYHTNQSFSENGEDVIFISYREGKSLLCKAHLPTGDITCLIQPVAGTGGLAEAAKYGDGKGIPIGAVLAPKSRWAYYVVEREIRAVQIDTLEEKIIVDDLDEKYFIESFAVSPDEENLVYLINLLRPKKDEFEYKIVRKPFGGQAETLVEEKNVHGDHVMYNPVDSDLLLFCRDKGPGPSDRLDAHSRTWIYKISQQQFTEVKTLEAQNFQTHTAWTWDGKGVVYHGMMADSAWENNVTEHGWYIGLAGADGNPVREYSFPKAKYYGHVSAMKGKNAAIIDGNILDGLLLWLSFDAPEPQIEIIAQHGTNFTCMPGQYAHPHAICSPTGRWIVYNSAPSIIFYGPRSDVYAVEV